MLSEETQAHIPTNADTHACTQNGLQRSANGKNAQMLSPCGVVCEKNQWYMTHSATEIRSNGIILQRSEWVLPQLDFHNY